MIERKRLSLIRPRLPAPADPGGGLYFLTPKDHIRFIHTGCTMLDCVLGGGWPLGRVSNLVGDKSTGKTLLAIEGIANFRQQYPSGIARYNEPEAAFDEEYAAALGVSFDNNIRIVRDCKTVEDFYDDVDDFAKECTEREVPGFYILDSLDALSDEAEMGRDIRDATYGGTKPKKMSEFFRRQTQDLRGTNINLLIISQTRDAIGVTFGERHTRSGGTALDFYASQCLWLAHLGILKRTVSKVERPVGIKVKAKAKKNKVGLPYRDCEFEITFGYGVEDEKASRAWLTSVGLGAGPKLEGQMLRDYVIKRWFEIEKTFLPTRRKYNGSDSE